MKSQKPGDVVIENTGEGDRHRLIPIVDSLCTVGANFENLSPDRPRQLGGPTATPWTTTLIGNAQDNTHDRRAQAMTR
jgi:hypothetical protein